MSNPRERENYSHQRKLFDPRHSRHVTIVGGGSVGSEVALLLASLGVPEFTVIDGDAVESHNLPMSFVFQPADLGRFKAEAIRDHARVKSGTNVRAITTMYDGTQVFRAGSVVASVDTMEARIAIWEAVKGNPNIDLLVDTRIHEHRLTVFAIRPNDLKDQAFYEKFLYPSSTTKKPMCGAHGVAYVTAIVAGLAARALTGFWSGATPNRREDVLLGDHGTFLETSRNPEP